MLRTAKKMKENIAYLLISLAVLISLEQYIFDGKFFDLNDVHHETFIVAFGFSGLLQLYLDRSSKIREEIRSSVDEIRRKLNDIRLKSNSNAGIK
jgi:hypothetical protein